MNGLMEKAQPQYTLTFILGMHIALALVVVLALDLALALALALAFGGLFYVYSLLFS